MFHSVKELIVDKKYKFDNHTKSCGIFKECEKVKKKVKKEDGSFSHFEVFYVAKFIPIIRGNYSNSGLTVNFRFNEKDINEPDCKFKFIDK